MNLATFIIARDRVTYLDHQIKWLERTGQAERIHIIDNNATYEPLLEYYKRIPHKVHFHENHGASSPWTLDEVSWIRENEYFIVTDHDVIPTATCPEDVIDRCHDTLLAYQEFDKVGPSLEISDIPWNNYKRNAVVRWEEQFWAPHRYHSGAMAWNSPIDTTFAVYRPGTPYKITEALRLDRPYTFHHQPWYINFDDLSSEERYYMDHAHHDISNWSRDELPDYLKELL